MTDNRTTHTLTKQLQSTRKNLKVSTRQVNFSKTNFYKLKDKVLNFKPKGKTSHKNLIILTQKIINWTKNYQNNCKMKDRQFVTWWSCVTKRMRKCLNLNQEFQNLRKNMLKFRDYKVRVKNITNLQNSFLNKSKEYRNKTTVSLSNYML